MSDRKQYIDSMVFDYETTANTDFKKYDHRPQMKTVYKSKHTPKKETMKPPIKYIHTMSDWKNVPVPFSLMIEQKQIVRTNPHHIQKPYERILDLEIDKIRRTRPRLVMTPAVSIDDVGDLEKRKLLVDDTYTTQVMTQFGHSCALSSVRTPLRGRYAASRPITLPQFTPSYVSPEWRMTSASWDRNQTRDFCDATQIFWLNRNST